MSLHLTVDGPKSPPLHCAPLSDGKEVKESAQQSPVFNKKVPLVASQVFEDSTGAAAAEMGSLKDSEPFFEGFLGKNSIDESGVPTLPRKMPRMRMSHESPRNPNASPAALFLSPRSTDTSGALSSFIDISIRTPQFIAPKSESDVGIGLFPHLALQVKPLIPDAEMAQELTSHAGPHHSSNCHLSDSSYVDSVAESACKKMPKRLFLVLMRPIL